jgi:hypothetical protein
MSTYWNVDVPKGSYSANISLIYMNKSTEKQGKIDVVGKEKLLLVKWLPAIVVFLFYCLFFACVVKKPRVVNLFLRNIFKELTLYILSKASKVQKRKNGVQNFDIGAGVDCAGDSRNFVMG